MNYIAWPAVRSAYPSKGIFAFGKFQCSSEASRVHVTFLLFLS